MHYAVNLGKVVEIRSCRKPPTVKTEVLVVPHQLPRMKIKKLRIIKFTVKGGRSIGKWIPYMFRAIFNNDLQPGDVIKVDTKLVKAYNERYRNPD